MRERLTWNPVDPAPYESAWSVFVKLMALNFCKPADIVRLIRKTNSTTTRQLDFRSGAWIDFDRYGALVGVDPNRLKAGFLDQLGFPQFASDDVHAGIRFCHECLKNGYHSILFDLALVAECPIHSTLLDEGCPVCSKTVASSGLTREPIPNQIPGGVIHDSAWRSDSYFSKCKHVYFDPDATTGIRRFNSDDRHEIRKASEAFILWWRGAFARTAAAPVFVAGLARRSYMKKEVRALGLCLDIAHTYGGYCPWPTSVSPSPASWQQFKRLPMDTGSSGGNRIAYDSDLGRVFRSIRRHIFDTFVRPFHWSCWQELSVYDFDMARAVCRDSVCTVVLAYMSWRMSIEGFSNIEAFGLRRSHRTSIVPVETSTAAGEVANFWYAQYFAILGRIEEMVRAGGNFYIERSSGAARFAGYSACVDDDVDAKTGTWGVAYANKEHSLLKGHARCAARKPRKETMLSETAADQMNVFGWTGAYSNYARPYLLFRIKDDAIFSRSYAHLCI